MVQPAVRIAIACALSSFASTSASARPGDGDASILTIDFRGGSVTTAHHEGSPGDGFLGGPPPDAPGIVNGDFSLGLTGWIAAQAGGSVTPGQVLPIAEQAVFAEGDSFLITLSQTFVVPPNAVTLRFDFSAIPGFDLQAMFIPDAFEAQLLDGAMQSVVPTWDPLATSFFNVQENGTMLLGAGTTVSGSVVTLDVSHLTPGDLLTLYFDLIGGDGDHQSGVTIDGVEIITDGCGLFADHGEYGMGWPGTLGVPAVSVLSEPQLGAALVVDVTSSNPLPTIGVGILSRATDSRPTPYGGTLLVSALPGDVVGIWTFAVLPPTTTVIHPIPDDELLCGVPIFGQIILADPGASHGFAFSRGLQFTLGG